MVKEQSYKLTVIARFESRNEGFIILSVFVSWPLQPATSRWFLIGECSTFLVFETLVFALDDRVAVSNEGLYVTSPEILVYQHTTWEG